MGGSSRELGDDDVRHVALGHLHLSGAAQDGKPNATLAAAHFERAAALSPAPAVKAEMEECADICRRRAGGV